MFPLGIIKGGWHAFKQFIYYKKNLKGILKKLAEIEPKLILWEATLAIPTLPSKILNLNIPIIALPHNIESLVFKQKTFFSPTNSPKYLKNELQQLMMCDYIFVASKFDYHSFDDYPQKLKIFHYSPPNVDFFEKIRKARLSTSKDFFLILGSVTNPPTYFGIDEMLVYLTTALISEPVMVAGNGTEKYNALLRECKNFTTLGFVNLSKLTYLLSNCKAIIINHPSSSGLINRLIECRISGVPIVGNRNYFKDYENNEGFYLFDNFSDLKKILKQSNFISPIKPENNKIEEKSFIETIKLFLN